MQSASSRKKRGNRVLTLSLIGSALAIAAVSARAQDFSGSAAVTSDYVFRGISQTQGDPALQLSGKIASESGFYALIWGSNVDYGSAVGADAEIDYVVGWGKSLNDDWAVDVNFTYFDYPGANVDIDYLELIGTVTYLNNYSLMLGYSADVFATDESGTYVLATAKFPFNDQFRLEAAGGFYFLDDAYNDDYSHAQLSAVWAFHAPFELRVSGHFTDSSAKDLFPGVAGSRLEVAVSASF